MTIQHQLAPISRQPIHILDRNSLRLGIMVYIVHGEMDTERLERGKSFGMNSIYIVMTARQVIVKDMGKTTIVLPQ